VETYIASVTYITLVTIVLYRVRVICRIQTRVLAMVCVPKRQVTLRNANVVVLGKVLIVRVRPGIRALAMVSVKKMAVVRVSTKPIPKFIFLVRRAKLAKNIGTAHLVNSAAILGSAMSLAPKTD